MEELPSPLSAKTTRHRSPFRWPNRLQETQIIWQKSAA